MSSTTMTKMQRSKVQSRWNPKRNCTATAVTNPKSDNCKFIVFISPPPFCTTTGRQLLRKHILRTPSHTPLVTLPFYPFNQLDSMCLCVRFIVFQYEHLFMLSHHCLFRSRLVLVSFRHDWHVDFLRGSLSSACVDHIPSPSTRSCSNAHACPVFSDSRR